MAVQRCYTLDLTSHAMCSCIIQCWNTATINMHVPTVIIIALFKNVHPTSQEATAYTFLSVLSLQAASSLEASFSLLILTSSREPISLVSTFLNRPWFLESLRLKMRLRYLFLYLGLMSWFRLKSFSSMS